MASLRKKVAFVQTVPVAILGIESMAALLTGHEIRVFILYIDGARRIEKDLASFAPDVVCFSCCTGDHPILLNLAARLKTKFPVPFIWGGPHATFFPEIIGITGVDVVVRGEAEHILPRLLENPDDTALASCWFKKPGSEIVRNPMGHLISDLDSLPFADRGLYRPFYRTLPYSSLNIVAGRGCPFRCAFCYNQLLKEMFEQDYSRGTYVRLRSPENVIVEIEKYVADFGRPRYVHFRDDTFIFKKSWVCELLRLYALRIRIPFTCLGRADTVDDEIAEALKEANIALLNWAVESGSERLRNEVCQKRIPDAKIQRCAEILQRHRIRFRTYNMMGLPTETVDDALLTVSLNQKIGNLYPLATIYDPYPNTELAVFAERQGLLKTQLGSGAYSKTQYDDSLIRCDERVLRVQRLFFFFVKFPRLNGVLRCWIEKAHPVVNKALFYVGYIYVFNVTYKYTFRELILLVARSLVLMGFGRRPRFSDEPGIHT